MNITLLFFAENFISAGGIVCQFCMWMLIAFLALSAAPSVVSAQNYPVAGTGQTKFYDDSGTIPAPAIGSAYYGQDANYGGHAPQYKDNGNGTVSDLVTGLMWQQTADLNGDGVINYSDKRTAAAALAGAKTFALGGYTDWRLPSIKALYSLIQFTGTDPTGGVDTSQLTPFIDRTYFRFAYGDVSAGDRIIDAQYVSSTRYVTTTMVNDSTAFGVNFADGRIKGYGLTMPGGMEKLFFVKYVRGNTAYGSNDFQVNTDSTITDRATGLMWQQSDSRSGMNWKDALAWVQQKNAQKYLGHNDWRLPSIKELQSIVDYSRSPKTTNSPAINPMFFCSTCMAQGHNEAIRNRATRQTIRTAVDRKAMSSA